FTPVVLGFLAFGGLWTAYVALSAAGVRVYLRVRLPANDPKLSFRWEWGDRRVLTLFVGNEGATLRDAGLSVFVPEECQWFSGIQADFNSRGIESTEEGALTPGEAALRWDDKNLHIQGGGAVEQFWFQTGAQPGTYPIRARLYDDADNPRAQDGTDSFTIPAPEVDQE